MSSIVPTRERFHDQDINPRLLNGTLVLLGLLLGVVAAYLVVNGYWQIALSLIFVLPGVVVLHKYPFLAVIAWLILEPFLLHTNTAAERRVYWIIHRALPPLTVIIILLSSRFRITHRELPKLGVPELFMAGYVGLSLLSIYLQNFDPLATTYVFYDRVFSPMCLYLIIRLSTPKENQLRWLIPVAFFISLSQSTFGILSWFAPQFLPSDWIDKAGTRTTGSLVNTSVYSTTLILSGLLMFHAALYQKSEWIRKLFLFVFLLSAYNIFISFSRAAWLAGIAVLLGLIYLYPKQILKLSLIISPVAVLLVGLIFSDQLDWARQRLYSAQAERSAVSRLAVYYAAIQMFQEKPIFGWGYENYNVYDRRYQWRVPGFPANYKDQSSHNLYLTIIAEQGMTGLLLFILPPIWWFARTLKQLPKMPKRGIWNRKLVIILWLVALSHIVVNNFSNMTVVFGLGMWWTVMGLIAHLVQTHPLPDAVRENKPNHSQNWVPNSSKSS